jgi:pimeloyl-ACP methyl ester carboxylesterase
VTALISEDVGPERPRSIAEAYARRVAADAEGWASEDELYARLKMQNPTMTDAVLRPYVRYATKRRADGRLIWKRDPNLVKGFVETDLWRFVSRITAPTLYVLGGRSNIVPAEAQQLLQARLPRVQLVVMPGLGHFPSDEQPDAFMAIVDRFLADPPVR